MCDEGPVGLAARPAAAVAVIAADCTTHHLITSRILTAITLINTSNTAPTAPPPTKVLCLLPSHLIISISIFRTTTTPTPFPPPTPTQNHHLRLHHSTSTSAPPHLAVAADLSILLTRLHLHRRLRCQPAFRHALTSAHPAARSCPNPLSFTTPSPSPPQPTTL